MDEIEEIIRSAELETEYLVWSGQCLSVAKALQECFGGRILFCTEMEAEGFNHALVEIDDKLYDGSGRVTRVDTVNRFIDKENHHEYNFFYPESPFEDFEIALRGGIVEDVLSDLDKADNSL
jgi:hypothetical protein